METIDGTFFMFVIFPVILAIVIFVIIPAIRRAIKKNDEYYQFKDFLSENGMYDSECQTATYKNIAEMDMCISKKELAVYSYYEGTFIILNFDEILDFEVEQNGNSIISSRTGSTITGGLLFGSLGAIAGASGSRTIDEVCHTLKLKIYTSDVSNSVLVVDFLESKVATESYKYDEITDVVDKMLGFLKIIKERTRQKERKEDIENVEEDNQISKLEKLSELKEKGIITQEEFEKSKKKILSKL